MFVAVSQERIPVGSYSGLLKNHFQKTRGKNDKSYTDFQTEHMLKILFNSNWRGVETNSMEK